MMKNSFHLFVLLCLCMALHGTIQLDSSSFVIYNEEHNKCVRVAEGNAVQAGDCDQTAETQHFRWISSSRLISVSHKLCLGVQDLKEWLRVLLVPCNELSLMQTWECKNKTLFGLKGQSLHLNYGNRDEPNVLLYTGTGSWSHWEIYGTKENLCTHGYEELFTIGGNSFGSPCHFPFKFGEKWYAECTLEGRADGLSWCSTESDYSKDNKWGFCPTKSISDWNTDPVTGVLYQMNTQSALTWHQARKSCQQQDADLLSIIELHEQTYISGLINILGSALWIGLNSLDFESGWQWSNRNPFRYLNWAPGHPSLEPGLNCAALNAGKASKWESMACSKKLGYICRKGNSIAIIPSIGKDQLSFCPVGWVPYAGHCYSLQHNKMMWKDALAACHEEGADLASIHNIEEYSFLISQSGYLPNDELWIGLNDQKTQNLFEWSDRTHVTFAMWVVGEPSHAVNHREDCVLMKGKEGKWADHMCDKEHGYICKKKASSKPAGLPELVSPGCPTGWIRFSSFCYSIPVEAKTFNESKLTCGKQGADLVQINDRYENAFLISQVGLRSEKYFWIGLSNTEQADHFEWTNKEILKFTHFNVGMPDKHQGCVAMLTGTSVGLWDVISCDQKQKYICKKIAEGVTTTKVPATTQPFSCPSDWIKKDSANCIQAYKNEIDNKKTWIEARDFCRAIGGDLASLHSESESNSLPIWNTAWIGFSSLDANTGFLWTDGTPSDYENWNSGEPNNYNNNEHCVEVILQHGCEWNDRDCDAYNDWICQISLGTTPKPPPTNVPQAEFNITADGWIEFSGYQYFINKNALSMEDARDFCKKNHSDLIVITGQTERKFIWKQISRSSDKLYYIGMTVALDKSFSWVDGSPVVFTAWNKNEPNFANNDENCVAMYTDMGFWNDINCGIPLPSICKRSINFVPNTMPPVTAPTGGCALEWVSFQGKCYKFLGKDYERTWHDARQFCISLGGNLVSIGSQAEQAFLTTMMFNTHDDVWIGLNDINWEMHFLWTDGKSVRFTNWAKGHPVSVPHDSRTYGSHPFMSWNMNHHKAIIPFIRWLEDEAKFDCAIMVRATDKITGMWKVEDCSEKRGFICKKNIDSQIQAPVTTASLQPYFVLGNNSFKLQMEKMNWDEARRQCRADDADLASVLDSITQALTILRIDRSKQPMWIGLNSILTGGQYRWVDNWMLSYVNWGKGEPSQNQACVYIDTDGYWKTANCSNTYYSFCKRSLVVAPTEPPQLSGNCPEPKQHKTWIPFRGHCYAFLAYKKENWAHATVECIRMGASLVSVEDGLESQFIHKNIEILQDESPSFWIGMHRSYEGNWMWIGNAVVDYTSWGPRMPGSHGDCVDVKSDSGLWFTSPCSNFKSFICKTAKVIPSTEKQPDPMPHMVEAPHGHAGTAVAVVLMIIAVAGLVAFLFFKRAPIPMIGKFMLNEKNARRSTTTVNSIGLVANIEENEYA
ncbi:macrophage mannose receptor 1-like isoform X2 [Electrophorus electricus]|uniref:macrophage mannose receptor 1-like isoform X2 n=1 Tax=Electrophorus electricus TaxID=8005 RepID=UPI0015D034EF|nr:macrophage mannose receptor 1-like isoform X2 [Electrophorus electricus]